MKTSSQNKSELGSRSAQSSSTNQNTAAAQPQTRGPSGTDRKDNRLPIDTEARKANRTWPTAKVLQHLQTQMPDVFRVAEVVGKWVWVQFAEQPAAEIRQQLAQLGFHWNRERQAWQHPCGNFRLSSSQDPHERYESYFPARIRKSAPTAQPAAA